MILDTNALSAFAEGDDSLGAQLETSAQLYLPVSCLVSTAMACGNRVIERPTRGGWTKCFPNWS